MPLVLLKTILLLASRSLLGSHVSADTKKNTVKYLIIKEKRSVLVLVRGIGVVVADNTYEVTRVVYHLHGETGSSTVCANGKQKSLMASSVQIGHLPFTQQHQIYRESLGRARPDHYSKMAVKNCKW